MKKIQKRLNAALTVLLIICAIICVTILVQIAQGKNASLFGFRIFHILTGSMEPTISVGSNVLVKETDTYRLSEGDIITFISQDQAIYGYANTHRIIAVDADDDGNLCYVTKGDANNTEDSIRVYPADIVGKVVFHVNVAGFSTFFAFLHTKTGFVTVIVLPVLFLMWLFIRDFGKQVRSLHDATDEELLEMAEQDEKPKKPDEEKSEAKQEEASEDNK